jgi:hypothetical protein
MPENVDKRIENIEQRLREEAGKQNAALEESDRPAKNRKEELQRATEERIRLLVDLQNADSSYHTHEVGEALAQEKERKADLDRRFGPS